MEFIYPNYINTTTQLNLPANTFAASNLYSQDLRTQYITDNFNDDATTASITITFDNTTAVSRIVLMETNLKGFTVFYNGSTSNTFALTSADTTASDWSSNSETSMFLTCSTIACSTITFDLKTTQLADSEKAIGRLIVSDKLLDFERVPASKNYKPLYSSIQVVHKMSDGGTRIQYIANKNTADIKFKHISASFRNSLKNVYDRNLSFIYAPFPTSTGWDAICWDAVWKGDFQFYRYSDDAVDAGFEGSISLLETSL